MDDIIEVSGDWPKTQTGGPEDDECDDIIVAGERAADETTLEDFEG